MRINNNSVIEKINNAIIDYNKDSKDEQLNLIKNGEIKDKDLKKIKYLHIDIGDISKEEINPFFEELANALELMKLEGLCIYAHNENIISDVDMTFLSRLNRELKELQIYNIDLSNVDVNVFNQFENLKVLVLGENNIKDFDMISKLNKELTVDVGDNPMSNVSISEVVNEINKRPGKIGFNGHPFLNSIVFALKDKKIDLSNPEIFKGRIGEILQFCKDYKIVPVVKPEDYQKFNSELQNPSNIIVSGTKDISTEFLIQHPEIQKIQIIDEENRCGSGQEEPYSREDFIKIKRKIEEIKQQIKIPDELDRDREKKIFMQVYIVLGKMIEYNHYAASKEGKEDHNLAITCRNLKDGLLEGKAVCAGYADILKNVLGEFGIKAQYIARNPEDMEKYAERRGYQEYVEMDEILGYEKTTIEEFVKSYGYPEDDRGHAWNSVILDGKKYLCDLTWDADDIKLEHFPLAYCCPSLDIFNFAANGDRTHDMYEIIEEGEVAEFSSEDQLRFLGFSEEEIEKKLHFSPENLETLLEEYENKRKLEKCAVSLSTEIKVSDFDGIDKAFYDKEKEEHKEDDEQYQ